MIAISGFKKIGLMLGLLFTFSLPLQTIAQTVKNNAGYMARDEGVKGIFDALSSVIGKPVILSKIAARKKITGDFDLTRSQEVLNIISNQLGLIWYTDQQAYYIYDASEMKNAVIVLHNTSFNVVNNFLKVSSLYDSRFPLRTDNQNATFYVSGPPIYVDLVSNAAKYLDQKSDGFDGRENIAVIPLFNTFVEDRIYKYREEIISIPGVANVINQVMGNVASPGGGVQVTAPANSKAEEEMKMPDFPETIIQAARRETTSLEPMVKSFPTVYGMSIVADPGTNSLLVRGSAEQVSYVRNLASALDTPKRHVELSVWIVDLQKDAFDNLGVKWSGNLNMGTNLGISLNGGTSTIDGASFMAAAVALSEKNQANIVSRPMILTQENIPAIFDNSRTFYTKLVGERTADVKDITYGTLVNVLPRFTENNEVEMMLNIQDGNQFLNSNVKPDDLPEVGRTNISTVARVPRGKSLLIGGYTRDESNKTESKIPWLGDLPWIGRMFKYARDSSSNMVRVFLIQPREIYAPLSPDAHTMISDMKNNLSDDQLQNWMANYLDSQKWR